MVYHVTLINKNRRDSSDKVVSCGYVQLCCTGLRDWMLGFNNYTRIYTRIQIYAL